LNFGNSKKEKAMLTIHTAKKTLLILLAGISILSSCNKELPTAEPIARPADGTSPTIAMLLDDPNFSIFKSAVIKAGLLPSLADPSLRFTVFAPDNAGMTASGFSQAAVDAYPASIIGAIVSYDIVPQVLSSAAIPASFPNMEYPSLLNPAPAVSPFLRLTTFPSKRGATVFVNNLPIIVPDITAVNGLIQKVPVLLAPPQSDLWSRISTDGQLTYFKAAIDRADSGVAVGSRLQDALNTAVNPLAIASNLTVFAPDDAAMKLFLTGALTQAFIQNGLDAATAFATATGLIAAYGSLIISNPASIPGIGPQLAAVITPMLAKGLVAYHILSSQTAPFAPPGIRAFSVNLPPVDTAVKTLLNSGVPVHPGVTIKATFGPTGVTAATIKGIANATASNVLINPFPNGTSDQNYVNGVLQIIDQVLLPQ
jgi:uncharacterized surface protein with fasciclin (FAS1) repeats